MGSQPWVHLDEQRLGNRWIPIAAQAHETQTLFALTAKNTQQSQQALEDIDDIQIQGQGCTDVVGLTAVDDGLDVIKHVGAKDSNGQHGDRHHARRGADKDIDQTAHHQHDCANIEPFAQTAQLALDDGLQTGHQEKHASGTSKGHHDQFSAVFKAQHHGNHSRKHDPHEKGKPKQYGYTDGGVFGSLNGIDETKCTHQEDDQAKTA